LKETEVENLLCNDGKFYFQQITKKWDKNYLNPQISNALREKSFRVNEYSNTLRAHEDHCLRKK